jgi:hypothetical protein
MKKMKMEQKAFIILENAPGHPNKLMIDDRQITVVFLLPNRTTLL